MTWILGVSALYHDSAAALLKDGVIVGAVQEERFTRRKHDPSFPRHAIDYLLRNSEINLSNVESVVFYDKPFLKFERLLESYLATAPRGLRSFSIAMPIWLREKLFLKNFLTRELRQIDEFFDGDRLRFAEHHMSHAAAAYYPSPFSEAVVLTLDGVGEWATASVSVGRENKLEMVKELHFPHSLGLLYSAFTYYVGFKVNSGEYKLMGLAPYGVPRFRDLILGNLIDLKEDGSFRVNLDYFDYVSGLTMTSRRFVAMFGEPVRRPDIDPILPFHMDVAASIQAVTEEIILRMTRSLATEFGIANLCLSGGVALNCVANSKVLRDAAFSALWIQPAAGDAGSAIGAAQAYWHKELDRPRMPLVTGDGMAGSYLGPAYDDAAIAAELIAAGAVFETLDEEGMISATAQALASNQAVGWFQGRMEFGPRALGGRSIIADPRSNHMQKTLNLKVKFRESFRPFAPAVLRESVADWFQLDGDSPYMLLVADVQPHLRRSMTEEERTLFGIDKLNVKRSEIPAVTHVDYSARIQTVHADTNPRFHALISAFRDLTGCPVLLNTSFNVRGEPIVCTPTDAFRCFMGTDLDMLAIGDHILRKSSQNQRLAEDYKSRYELD
jgi:carbamoyltransferase